MPGGDGTGPMGMGPMSGRGAGFCAGYGAPGYMNPIPGRGWWGTYGGPYPTTAQPAKEDLASEIEMLKAAKADIDKRIEEIGKQIKK